MPASPQLVSTSHICLPLLPSWDPTGLPCSQQARGGDIANPEGGPRGGWHGTLTLMLLEGRVGLPHRDQDEEEEEGPQELNGQLDLGDTHGWGGPCPHQ